MERFFPLIMVRKKSSDCPWINGKIRRLIKKWKGIYRSEGRSEKWRKLKKLTEELLKKRQGVYLQS